MRFLITGGAGFIGSAVIRYLINETTHDVLNLDKLTYAGNLDSLKSIEQNQRYSFKQVDICDGSLVEKVFKQFQPDIIMHLAAESHVDRSIDGPAAFIQTNIIGTFNLLEVAKSYYKSLEPQRQKSFRFHHVSTDEVYGDLKLTDPKFDEENRYDPSSPYSASKASSDHLVRAWARTYALPTVITNCSNNYGPYQFPEKLIPLVILKALRGENLPVYGDGQQIRDWLFVEDHAQALCEVAICGKIGETYNIGGHNEKTNLEVVNIICNLLDEFVSNKPLGVNNFSQLITFVKDRPGHDQRYAINSSKIQSELGWTPNATFESGILKTIQWYLDNQEWINRVIAGTYRQERLGTGN